MLGGMDLSALTDFIDPSPFAAPWAVDAGEEYTNAVVVLLAEGGPEVVSMAAVARYRQQAASAVKQRIGGREAFLLAVVDRFSERWLDWVGRPPLHGPVKVRLPQRDDEIHGMRVWRVLREIAAGEARAGRTELAEHVAEADAPQRADLARHLRRVTGRTPTEAELTAMLCLARGLRDAMADQVDPLGLEAAQAALELVADRLDLAAQDEAAGS